MKLVIDGENLFYRSYWVAGNYGSGAGKQELMMILVFLTILKSYVKTFRPDEIIVTWDQRQEGYVNERKEIDTEYKANRTHDPSIYVHLGDLKEILTSLGVKQLYPRTREGDDILYWLCAYKYPGNCAMVSTDTDMYQLVLPHLRNNIIWNPTKKEVVDSNYLLMNYDVNDGHEFIVKKALRGDSSDNIRGIKGLRSKKIKEITRILGDDMNYEALEKSNLLTEQQVERFKTNVKLMFLDSIKDCSDEIEFYEEQLDKPVIPSKNTFTELIRKLDLKQILSRIDYWYEELALTDTSDLKINYAVDLLDLI